MLNKEYVFLTKMQPIFWKKAEAQREYEYSSALLNAIKAGKDITPLLERKIQGSIEDNEYDYSTPTSFVLGFCFMFGLSLFFWTTWSAIGIYVASLSLYHMLEYLYVWRFQAKDCCFNCKIYIALLSYSVSLLVLSQ